MEKNKNIYKIRKTFIHPKSTIILSIVIILLFLSSTLSKATDDTVISAENWSEWQQEDYWDWHTRTTTNDKAYNGRHIVIQNDVIDFYGYGQNSYKDFLYKEYENKGKKTFKFIIDETRANYHTLDGAGFIFNADIKDDKMSGYILLFRQQDISVYRLNNVDVNAFENTSTKTVENYGQLINRINKTNKQLRELLVEASPTKIRVEEDKTEILNLNLKPSIHVGESFGLISSYVQHDCNILSEIEFSQLQVIIEDYDIKILNTDLEENSILGAHFVVRDENGKIVKNGKTEKDGTFKVNNLQAGQYTIQQTIRPSGYMLNKEIYTFKITEEGKIVDNEDKEIELIVKNAPYIIEEENNEENDKKEEENKIEEKQPIEEKKEEKIVTNQKDPTVSKIALPYAGGVLILLRLVVILSIVASIILFIKLKIYKK